MSIELFQDILRCPRTGSPLEITAKSCLSQADNYCYPMSQRIPWLFKEPDRTVQEWRTKYEFQMAQLERESQNLLGELKLPNLAENTQRRLRRIQQAVAEQAKAIAKIMEPLHSKIGTKVATHLAFKTELPETQTLMSYYPNIFRDWCWGDEENQLSLELLRRYVPNSIDTMVVLGAGGCRLAVDLHQECAPKRSLAVDINPFLFLTARKIINGQKVQLYEFPMAPVDIDSFAVKRTLAWPGKLRDGFAMLFADALNPPFAPQSIDLLITPWFVDIVPQDSAAFMRTANHLLKPGGLWINFGSLAYLKSMQHLCYSREEFIDLLGQSGFHVDGQEEKRLPYLQSPSSCQQRYEKVLLTCARKVDDRAPLDQEFHYLPDYIRNHDMPIPKQQGLQDIATANQMIADLLVLIDGTRSQQQLAQIFAEKINLEPEQAASMIYGLLVRIFEEQARGRQF